jgi:hypothetical protein
METEGSLPCSQECAHNFYFPAINSTNMVMQISEVGATLVLLSNEVTDE